MVQSAGIRKEPDPPADLAEAHQIKSFADVMTLYQKKGALVDDPTRPQQPAFYNFQRSHPAFNAQTLKKYES